MRNEKMLRVAHPLGEELSVPMMVKYSLAIVLSIASIENVRFSGCCGACTLDPLLEPTISVHVINCQKHYVKLQIWQV